MSKSNRLSLRSPITRLFYAVLPFVVLMVLVFPNLFHLTVLNFQTSPNFTHDPAFNILSAMDASPYRYDFHQQLARAQSQDEFDYISNKMT